jgi:Holliday junction resolvase
MSEEAARIVYSNLTTELQAATQWLDRLSIAYSATRFGSYKKTLNELEAARLAGIDMFDAASELGAFASLFESNELVTIHQGLADKRLDTYLRPRLKELTSGPDSYVNENASSSNKARNTGFELAVMARLATAGLSIGQDGGLPDVVAQLGGTSVIVECKRPQSEAGIPRAISDARNQLAKRYREARRSRPTGFIALDITKACNPALSVTSDMRRSEVVSQINLRMESLVKKYANSWNGVREEQTAGVLLRLSVLAWIKEDRTMSWFHKSGITPFVGRSKMRVGIVREVEQAVNHAVMSDGSS